MLADTAILQKLVVKDDWHDFHAAVLGLYEAISLELVFTDTIKLLVGRYRPDWFDSFSCPC